MIGRIAVGDIMTRNLTMVKLRASLYSCAKQMVKQRVNSVLIVENKKLLGILTAQDILWTLTKKPSLNIKNMEARDIATKKVAVIKPSADISEALRKMRKYGFRRLPVISKGEIVGIITLKDILRVDPELYNQLGELLTIREETQKAKKLITHKEYETEGFCEECGAFANLLKVEGKILCPDCRDELF